MKTDDEQARALLGPMLSDIVPPSKVEVSELVVAGRRRVRARRWAGISGAGVLTAAALVTASVLVQPAKPPNIAQQTGVAAASSAPAVSQPAPAFPTSCTGRLLPVPAGSTSSYVSGGDPSGRYLVGGYGTDMFDHRPVLWDNGNPILIPAPGDNLMAIVVNADGVVAGTSDKIENDTLELFNWIYRDGKVSLLEEVATEYGSFIQVIGINSRGDILVDSRFGSKDSVGSRRAGIWKAYGQGGLHELADPGNLGRLTASALDEDGTVVGRYLVSQGFSGERTLVWTADGQLTKPSPPAGFGEGGALRLVRGGFAVGNYQQPGKQPHETVTFLRNLRTGEDIAIPALALAGAVNRHGWMGGLVREAGQVQTPAIATDTKLVKLPLPAGAVPSSDGVGAYYLSDNARTVAGNVAVSADHLSAAAWSCQ